MERLITKFKKLMCFENISIEVNFVKLPLKVRDADFER